MGNTSSAIGPCSMIGSVSIGIAAGSATTVLGLVNTPKLVMVTPIISFSITFNWFVLFARGRRILLPFRDRRFLVVVTVSFIVVSTIFIVLVVVLVWRTIAIWFTSTLICFEFGFQRNETFLIC